MEIELDLKERWWIVFLPIVVVLIVLLILLGRSVTPAGDAVLTTMEWKHRKAERVHQVELAALRGASEELAEILNHPPDAVRANMTATKLAQKFSDGGRFARAPEGVASLCWGADQGLGYGSRDEGGCRGRITEGG